MTVEEVVVRLQADNILTPYQANLICAEKTPFEKNQKLIDFVQKRGPKAFSCFMKSLTETGQQYIFEKLIEERKTIARREYLSTLSMWSTKIKTSATQKANLESLITKEELEQLKDIRVKKIPEEIGQIGKGLVYLHSRRPTAVVHRDIKCENLLLTTEDNVKLADFGLAINLVIDNGSKTNLSTAPKSFVGTHLFHAPEILQTVNKPEAYGRKSDIWSLACTLVQMLSGEPPYRNNKEMQLDSITLDICIVMDEVCLNLMKKLLNGTQNQQNKAMQMDNLTLD
uniref:Protein kinase domain-containing protein n=1 Tax=Plectus sambesii TaxID=2011161 RepID=A0A914W030_9BILA